jgi:hypothetical protein
LWLNSPDLDAFSFFYQLRDTTTDENGPGSLNTVDIFAASTAGGNVAPIATIAGANTTFVNFISSVTVDASNNVYVTEITGANEVLKFNAGSTGNVAPNGTITTGLNTPHGIVVDASGNIYVSNKDGNTITVYSSNGTLIQTISGASTLMNAPYELALWPVTGSAMGKGFFFAP